MKKETVQMWNILQINIVDIAYTMLSIANLQKH